MPNIIIGLKGDGDHLINHVGTKKPSQTPPSCRQDSVVSNLFFLWGVTVDMPTSWARTSCVTAVETRISSVGVCEMCSLLRRRAAARCCTGHTLIHCWSPPEEGQNFCPPFKHEFSESRPIYGLIVLSSFFPWVAKTLLITRLFLSLFLGLGIPNSITGLKRVVSTRLITQHPRNCHGPLPTYNGRPTGRQKQFTRDVGGGSRYPEFEPNSSLLQFRTHFLVRFVPINYGT